MTMMARTRVSCVTSTLSAQQGRDRRQQVCRDIREMRKARNTLARRVGSIKTNNIGTIISGMFMALNGNSQEEQTQLESLMKTLQLSIMNSTNSNGVDMLVQSPRCLELLVRLLEENSPLQDASISILQSFAISYPDQLLYMTTDTLVSPVECLFRLLHLESTGAGQSAEIIDCLGTTIKNTKEEECRDALMGAGFIPLLVGKLEKQHSTLLLPVMSTFDKLLQHKTLPPLSVIQPILNLSVLIIRDYECNLENLELLMHSLECLGSCTSAYSPAVYVVGSVTLLERIQMLASTKAELLPSVCRIWKHMSSEYYAPMIYQREGFVDLARNVLDNSKIKGDVMISMLEVLKMMPRETFLSHRLLALSKATTGFKVRRAALLCLFKMLKSKSNNHDESLLSEIMDVIIEALSVKIDADILLGALNVIPNILDHSGVGVIPLFGQLGGMDALETLALHHTNADVNHMADQLLDRFCNDESSTTGVSYGEDDDIPFAPDDNDELWKRCYSPECHKHDLISIWEE